MLQIEPLSVFFLMYIYKCWTFFCCFFFFFTLEVFFVVSPKFQLLAVNCQDRLCLCMYLS